jgi:CheY-like chemotaxis protein
VPAKRILLVDDYPDALDMWGLYLRSVGYDVDTAADGLEALDHAHRGHPDAIVLDLQMPGITGYEAAQHLRSAEDTCDIPLIAATGYSHVAQLEEARQCGFDAILLKPCEPAELVAEIERVLKEHRREGPPPGHELEGEDDDEEPRHAQPRTTTVKPNRQKR